MHPMLLPSDLPYQLPRFADFTDDEITATFDMGKAFGVDVLTSSTQVSLAPRLEPFAAKAGMRVGFHNHSNIRPDEVATPDDFASILKAGPHCAVTLDIGHFTAAKFDALAFLEAHHDRIVSMHLKDRKRTGETLPFGDFEPAGFGFELARLADRFEARLLRVREAAIDEEALVAAGLGGTRRFVRLVAQRLRVAAQRFGAIEVALGGARDGGERGEQQRQQQAMDHRHWA